MRRVVEHAEEAGSGRVIGGGRADAPGPDRIGLACAGGAFEGAMYEIGALCALQEAVAGLDLNALDVYVGVSAGALVTSNLANGIPVDELSRAAVGEAEDPAMDTDADTVYRPALAEYRRRLAHLPAVVRDAARGYLEAWRRPSVLGPWAAAGRLLPTGFFDNAPLEEHLRELFSRGGRTNRFDELDARLRIVAVDVDTAEVTTFGDAATAHVPISKAVQASTALPILYCPVEVDGKFYIDGVARRTVHASVALDAGARLLFCLNPIVPVLNPREAGSANSSLIDQGLPGVLSQMFRLVVYSRMQTGFRRYDLAYPDADIILIEPSPRDSKRIFSNIFSFSNRRYVCDHAYRTTRAFLRENAAEIGPVLERHGMHLRLDVLAQTHGLYDKPSPERRRTAGTRVYRGAEHALKRLDRVLARLEGKKTAEQSTPNAA